MGIGLGTALAGTGLAVGGLAHAVKTRTATEEFTDQESPSVLEGDGRQSSNSSIEEPASRSWIPLLVILVMCLLVFACYYFTRSHRAKALPEPLPEERETEELIRTEEGRVTRVVKIK